MGYRKSYKTSGARMVYGVDGGAVANARIPYGTLTAVDCPDCPSLAGSKCISSTGKLLNQVHISRRRIAMRKYNAELQEKADG
jgi:hypothetical protein